MGFGIEQAQRLGLLEARQQMPGSVINTSTGSKLIFSA